MDPLDSDFDVAFFYTYLFVSERLFDWNNTVNTVDSANSTYF